VLLSCPVICITFDWMCTITVTVLADVWIVSCFRLDISCEFASYSVLLCKTVSAVFNQFIVIVWLVWLWTLLFLWEHSIHIDFMPDGCSGSDAKEFVFSRFHRALLMDTKACVLVIDWLIDWSKWYLTDYCSHIVDPVYSTLWKGSPVKYKAGAQFTKYLLWFIIRLS